jgi:hypothetical protein
MKRKTVFFSFFILLAINICEAQSFIRTADLFRTKIGGSRSGELNIIQDLSVDSLLSRYILANRLREGVMDGFRIQIYSNSNRNAREESNKVRAEFMIAFPDIPSYAKYREPGYFLIRAGDFRTKVEGTKSLYQIRKKYPNAYLVPDVINFPDLNKK